MCPLKIGKVKAVNSGQCRCKVSVRAEVEPGVNFRPSLLQILGFLVLS